MPAKSSPLLTLSIVSHGDADKLPHLLESIQRYENSHSLQIILTDNLGHDLPEADASAWADVSAFAELIILRNKDQKGFAHNHNQAFQHATGKYFCVLNPDLLFEEAIFAPLINRIKNGDAAILSPIIFDSDGVLQDSFRDFPTPLEIIKRKLPYYKFQPQLSNITRLIFPDWIAGMFMLMRHKTYQQIGGFDEKFHMYFEDVDFCARARALGLFPVVDASLRIQHNAQRASRKNLRYLGWHIQSAFRFFGSSVYKELEEK